MTASSYELGWQVLRARFTTDVPPDRLRRALWIGALVAVGATAVLVTVGLLVGWPDLSGAVGWIGTLFLAIGAGGFAVACVPMVPRPADASKLYWSGSVMQAPERTERYFRRGPAPTVAPADRDEVLRDAELIISGQVPDILRGFVVTVAGVLVGVALLVTEAHIRVFGFVSVYLLVQLVVGLVRLGRVERARALAASLPEQPSRPPTSSRPNGTRRAEHRPGRGSKLGLPGE